LLHDSSDLRLATTASPRLSSSVGGFSGASELGFSDPFVFTVLLHLDWEPRVSTTMVDFKFNSEKFSSEGR
jgi:hypothetical protein